MTPDKDLAPLFRPYVGTIVGHPILQKSAAEIKAFLEGYDLEKIDPPADEEKQIPPEDPYGGV